MRSQWDEEQVALLREMIAAGRTGGQIADAMGRSRSAVMGKANRLGLSLDHNGNAKSRAGSASAAASRARKARTKTAPPTKPTARTCALETQHPPVAPPLTARKSVPRGARPLLNLGPRDCRWPVTDGPPHLFCARRAEEGRSYCAAHCAIAGAGYGKVVAPRWGRDCSMLPRGD